MKFIFNIKNIHERIFSPVPSLWGYCLRLGLLLIVTALPVRIITELAMDDSPGANPWAGNIPGRVDYPVSDIFGYVIVAPLVETLWMLVVVAILANSSRSLNRVSIAAVVAFQFGLMHVWMEGWVRFPVSCWVFFVLTLAYLAWKPVSGRAAFIAAAAPHALLNGVALGMVAGL